MDHLKVMEYISSTRNMLPVCEKSLQDLATDYWIYISFILPISPVNTSILTHGILPNGFDPSAENHRDGDDPVLIRHSYAMGRE